jgi:hypothetical protein
VIGLGIYSRPTDRPARLTGNASGVIGFGIYSGARGAGRRLIARHIYSRPASQPASRPGSAYGTVTVNASSRKRFRRRHSTCKRFHGRHGRTVL